MGAPSPLGLVVQLTAADEAGVKLEVVKDVVVVDPDGRHFRRDGSRPLALGATVAPECGCELTIPDVG